MDSERTRVTLVPTGDPRVDEAIAGLSDLDQIDLDDRPAVLEEVHDRLREILGELGDAGRRAPGAPAARRARRRGEQASPGPGRAASRASSPARRPRPAAAAGPGGPVGRAATVGGRRPGARDLGSR